MGLAVTLAAFAGCATDISAPTSGPTAEIGSRDVQAASNKPVDPTLPDPVPATPATAAISGARRLTNRELAASVSDLLGIPADATLAGLPADVLVPFDNDITKQTASAVYVEALDAAMKTLSSTVLADTAHRAAFVGCTPTAVDDTTCLKTFIRSFGRRVLRRPLSEDEVTFFASSITFATRGADFYRAVDAVTRRLLQDPEFLYRVELGTPVDGKEGVFALTQHELAARLSYALIGSTPPTWLLDAADAQQLSTDAQVRAAANQLFTDPRAMELVQRYHAMWLGYAGDGSTDLEKDFRTETRALVNRTFADHDAYELFSSRTTYANQRLATQYGLSAPAGGFPASGWAWLNYGDDSMRSGVLGQGAVLANGAKFGDTSPVGRGKFVSERLLCRTLGTPPANVNTDTPPQSPDNSPCKRARYAAHSANPTCKGCHSSLDAIGFGLENFDQKGQYRTVEAALPQCAIDGTGTLGEDVGFHGPKDLVTQLTEGSEFESCLVTQMFRFTYGRKELPTDRAQLRDLKTTFDGDARKMKTLLLTMVTSELFRQRMEEQSTP